MTDFDSHRSIPILTPEEPPEHREDFWSDLAGKLVSVPTAAPGPTVALPAVSSTRRVTRWPLAAAAALVAIGGLVGVVLLNAHAEPAVVASAATQVAPAPLDGPDDGTGTGPQSEVASDRAPTAAPQAPAPATFGTAPGADAQSVRLPTDGGLSETAIFLGTSEQLDVSWFAVSDPRSSCDDQRHAEIRSVDRAGATRPVHDPQLWFSGELSLLSFRPDGTAAAWIASCRTQVELYAATLTPAGGIDRLDLVWVGAASPSGALILWDGTEVGLNAIGSTGEAFNVSYEMTTGQTLVDGAPAPQLLDDEAPSVAGGSPLGAVPDGRFSYWYGVTGEQAGVPCVGPAPDAESLWLYDDAGSWSPALVDSVALGEVTALAVDHDSGQIAFADACEGTAARLLVGVLRADGRIGDLRQLALTPFAPGFVDKLLFADASTVRFEVDNASRGFGRVTFDFGFENGFDEGLVVQID